TRAKPSPDFGRRHAPGQVSPCKSLRSSGFSVDLDFAWRLAFGSMTPKRVCLLVVALLILTAPLSTSLALAAETSPGPRNRSHIKEGGVNIEQKDGKLVIEIGAHPFAEYYYQN